MFKMQIRCLWREQWPFKVRNRISCRMRDIFFRNSIKVGTWGCLMPKILRKSSLQTPKGVSKHALSHPRGSQNTPYVTQGGPKFDKNGSRDPFGAQVASRTPTGRRVHEAGPPVLDLLGGPGAPQEHPRAPQGRPRDPHGAPRAPKRAKRVPKGGHGMATVVFWLQTGDKSRGVALKT